MEVASGAVIYSIDLIVDFVRAAICDPGGIYRNWNQREVCPFRGDSSGKRLNYVGSAPLCHALLPVEKFSTSTTAQINTISSL